MREAVKNYIRDKDNLTDMTELQRLIRGYTGLYPSKLQSLEELGMTLHIYNVSRSNQGETRKMNKAIMIFNSAAESRCFH